MGNRPQSAQNLLQPLIFKEERIPSGQEDIPNLSMTLQILDDLFKIPLGDGPLAASHQSPSRAVSAIDGTLIGDEQEHSIRITMDESRHRGMLILSARIHHFTF